MNAIAILSLLGVLTQPVQDGVIGGQYVRGETGIVYVAGWWSYPDLSKVPDSETVQNVTAGEFTKEQAVAILASGKALVIHGLPQDLNTALNLFGLTWCNEDGSDIAVQ